MSPAVPQPRVRVACRFLVLATLLAACGEDRPPAERALLITCDTLRQDRLGVYGAPGDTTPNLDRFADECVVFDKAYASAPLTAPALSTLMTGRLTDELGTYSNRHPMPASATTIAEVVRDAGIPTAAVVSNWVLRRREDGADIGLEQGFDDYDATMESAEENRRQVMERTARATTDAALEWLDGARGRGERRFFLWVHYQDPHGPYTPPEEFLRPPDALALASEPVLRLGKSQRGFGELPDYQALGSERRPAVYRQRYEAEIRYFDHELGRLLDALARDGWLHDALVIFTADHGESLGEHGWWFSHGQTLFDELLRVPLLVRYPDGMPRPALPGAGNRVTRLVGHVDVPATVLEALGLPVLATHGISLSRDTLPADRIVPHHLRSPEQEGMRWMGITSEDRRLLLSPKHLMLFDPGTDPGETRNLQAQEPERFQELLQRYAEEMRALPPLGETAREEALGEEDLERLRELGYTGDEE